MKKTKLTLLILVVSTLLFLSTPKVNAPMIPHEYTLDIPCYAPTKITFNYAYTHNHSISDISTFGSSLYTHTGGPNFYQFIAQDVDEYHFTLELDYASPVNQTILVGIWSGSLPMQGLNFKSYFEQVKIYVRLRVQAEPKFPTSEEVAQQTVLQISKNLADQYNAINKLIESQNTAMIANSAMILVVSITTLLNIVLNFFALRKVKPKG